MQDANRVHVTLKQAITGIERQCSPKLRMQVTLGASFHAFLQSVDSATLHAAKGNRREHDSS